MRDCERPRGAEERGENIRVICRFRPLNERELALERKGGRTAVKFCDGGRSVWVGPDDFSAPYTLDSVLPPEATQQDLYSETSNLVDALMQGYNGTVLAYGQVRSLMSTHVCHARRHMRRHTHSISRLDACPQCTTLLCKPFKGLNEVLGASV